MLTATPITALGHDLDRSPEAFGWMCDSSDLLADPPALRQRLDRDGYLFLHRYLDRDEVLAARAVLCDKLAAAGQLDPDAPRLEAVAHPDSKLKFAPNLAEDNAPLMRLLYAGRMIALHELLFGEPVRHFDFTWVRAVSGGHSTPPHCDSVYMNRGTWRLLTTWTPLGDIPIEQGGLIVLEGSHADRNERLARLHTHYCHKDVDTFCTNLTPRQVDGFGGVTRGGYIGDNVVNLQRNLGGRWLTRECYEAGDVVVFPIVTVHGGLDNHTNRFRLSCDTRYQPASEPADERWISVNGAKPIGHSQAGKRGRVC